MSGEQERLEDGAALVRLTDRISLVHVKKRQGCYYKQNCLFATAWTLQLSECEKMGSICHRQKKRPLSFLSLCLSACPFAVQPTCSYTLLLLWPHFVQDTSFFPFTATSRSNLSYNSSYLKVSGRLTCTQRRGNLAETDDKC